MGPVLVKVFVGKEPEGSPVGGGVGVCGVGVSIYSRRGLEVLERGGVVEAFLKE